MASVTLVFLGIAEKAELLALAREEWRISRLRSPDETIRRDYAAVLGTMGSRRGLERILTQAINSREPPSAFDSYCYGLQSFSQGVSANDVLTELRSTDRSTRCRALLLAAFGSLPSASAEVRRSQLDPDPVVRRAGAEALRLLKD
jgi:hypothetical protein